MGSPRNHTWRWHAAVPAVRCIKCGQLQRDGRANCAGWPVRGTRFSRGRSRGMVVGPFGRAVLWDGDVRSSGRWDARTDVVTGVAVVREGWA